MLYENANSMLNNSFSWRLRISISTNNRVDTSKEFGNSHSRWLRSPPIVNFTIIVTLSHRRPKFPLISRSCYFIILNHDWDRKGLFDYFTVLHQYHFLWLWIEWNFPEKFEYHIAAFSVWVLSVVRKVFEGRNSIPFGMADFKKYWTKRTVLGLGLGQFLSLLITSTGFSSSELAKRGLLFFYSYILLFDGFVEKFNCCCF